MESSGAADGKRKKEEENAGMVYMGTGRVDEAGRRPDFSPTWGSGERELGGIQTESRPYGARAGREGVGKGAATWARRRGRGARSGGGGAPAVADRLEVREGADRWAPPVSARGSEGEAT
uniref:Retrotransposon protein, putative, Ty3-gypsy sub-class n=2 Tax=Oryza sativa subsp. japonica TaxID=39947 RepID=Q7G4R6_ORYSJ|nr:retrotransposon protein, putative, Ty3-gypsy sub-class [Oryza sativa Japonica Group]AAP52514.1 retrotransposon protein, putative, Ty3-gypsy subclass [Oryza sativa Japonica Group]